MYPTSPKITITVRMINNQIFQKEYGSPTIILPDIFVAAIITGDTKGNNNIGNNTSLNLARIAMPETKLAMAIIAQLINKVVPMAIQGCDGKSIIKNLKNGMEEIREYMKTWGIQDATRNEINNLIAKADVKISQLNINNEKLLYFSELIRKRGY